MSEPMDAQTAGLGAAALVLIGAAYKFLRIIKGDSRADRAAAFADQLRAEMGEKIKHLEERVDKFAAERNEAKEIAARLGEQVKSLSAQVEQLTRDKTEMGAVINALRAELRAYEGRAMPMQEI